MRRVIGGAGCRLLVHRIPGAPQPAIVCKIKCRRIGHPAHGVLVRPHLRHSGTRVHIGCVPPHTARRKAAAKQILRPCKQQRVIAAGRNRLEPQIMARPGNRPRAGLQSSCTDLLAENRRLRRTCATRRTAYVLPQPAVLIVLIGRQRERVSAARLDRQRRAVDRTIRRPWEPAGNAAQRRASRLASQSRPRHPIWRRIEAVIAQGRHEDAAHRIPDHR